MTPDLEALREIEKRLTEAKGADRELDRELFWRSLPAAERKEWETGRHVPTRAYMVGVGRLYEPLDSADPERFTASLDAAIGLCERVLESWGIELNLSRSRDGEWYWVARTVDPSEPEIEGDEPRKFYGVKPHPHSALALCLAAVRSLIAQAETRPAQEKT